MHAESTEAVNHRYTQYYIYLNEFIGASLLYSIYNMAY